MICCSFNEDSTCVLNVYRKFHFFHECLHAFQISGMFIEKKNILSINFLAFYLFLWKVQSFFPFVYKL